MSERRPEWGGVALVCVLLTVVAGALVGGTIADDCAANSGQMVGRSCQTLATTAEDTDLDNDSDSAPFMIVVEHEDGWRCAASLVSLRTSLTSARCARGQGSQQARGGATGVPHELWALAAAQLSRRTPNVDHSTHIRPTSPASTARRVSRIALAGDRRRGDDPLLDDLAVLELETPFGAAARALPILMATSRIECEKEKSCHAVRAVAAAGTHRVHFRVVDAGIVSEGICASRVAYWPDVRDRAFCFASDELCTNDRGAGVVCGGKLCGVLSDSVSADAQRDDGCGETHVAMSVARGRPFLHCAHTLHACGRGDCESLCSEHHLLNDDSSTESETVETHSTLDAVPNPPAVVPQRSKAPVVFTLAEATNEISQQQPPFPPRGAHVFEPNRPDFKAGEYGDNVADYEETVPTTRRRPMVSRSVSHPAIFSATRTREFSPIVHSAPPSESLRSCCYYRTYPQIPIIISLLYQRVLRA